MFPFGRKKREDEEDQELKSEGIKKRSRRKKKEEILPWTKKERIFVFVILLITIGLSGFLAFSARKWKLPGLPRIKLPELFSEKVVVLDLVDRSESETESEAVKTEFKRLTKDLSGVYGFYVYRLDSNQEYGLYQDEMFPAASLIKLPVMITLYKEAEKENLDLDVKYSLKEEDKKGGAGSLQYQPAGTLISYRQMAKLMGQVSDNTAFNIVRERLGDRKIQEMILNLGMLKTSLAEFETSPQDIGLLFKKLYTNQVLNQEDSEELLEYLTNTGFEDRIPAGIPENIRVAHKIGSDVGAISDAGIIFTEKPFILVIMSKGVIEKEAVEILPELARLVYEFEAKN